MARAISTLGRSGRVVSDPGTPRSEAINLRAYVLKNTGIIVVKFETKIKFFRTFSPDRRCLCDTPAVEKIAVATVSKPQCCADVTTARTVGGQFFEVVLDEHISASTAVVESRNMQAAIGSKVSVVYDLHVNDEDCGRRDHGEA
jgi:hypothetical protein